MAHPLETVPDPFAVAQSPSMIPVAAARFHRLEAIERSHRELAETITGMVACIQTHANDERGLNRRLVEDYLGEAVKVLGEARRLMR